MSTPEMATGAGALATASTWFGRGLPLHLRIFECLMYGSFAVTAAEQLWNADTFGLLVLPVQGILTWAAARRGQAWPALILVLCALAAGLTVIASVWPGAPRWIHFFAPESVQTPLSKIMDAVSSLLAITALAFYFVGNVRAGAHSRPAKPVTPDGIPQTVPLRETCGNCGTRLVGLYCHNCSQSSAQPILTFHEGVSSLLYAFMKIDHKLLRTLQLALLSPGKLSVDYRNGIYVRYTPPMRFIFLISISVLLLFALTDVKISQLLFVYGPNPHVERDANGAPRLVDVREEFLAIARALPPQKPPPRFLASLEQELAKEHDGEHAGTLRYWLAIATGDPHLTQWNKGLPIGFLLMAPVFAALLMLFFRRQRYPFSDHLVFAIHVHAFALLSLLAIVPLVLVGSSFVQRNAMHMNTALLFGYIVIGSRTFYGATWLAAVAKGSVLALFDNFLVALVLAGLSVIAEMTS